MRKLLIIGTAVLLAIALGVGPSLAQKSAYTQNRCRENSRHGEISF